jgi:hypothetical protein
VGQDVIVSTAKELGGDVVWSFSTPDVAPQAIAPLTYLPTRNATAVVTTTAIEVTFDNFVPTSGTDFSGVKILAAGSTTNLCTNVAIKDRNLRTLTLSHAALTAGNTVYTVTIPAWSIPGLASNVTWSFTLENLPFPLSNYTPANGSTTDDIQQVISLSITPKARLTGLDWSGVTVKTAGDPTNYYADVQISNPTMFNPSQTISIYTISAGLPYNKTFTVTIPKTAIPAQGGFELKEDIVWSFSTAAAILEKTGQTPAAGTTVSADAAVTVTFNKPINANGAPTLSRISISGAMSVSASFSGNVIRIAHADFAPNSTYTVKIPAGTISGYNQNIEWSFSTGNIPIIVDSVSPRDNAVNVKRDTVIAVTFNKSVYINGTDPDWSKISFVETLSGTAVNNVFVNGAGISGNSYVIFHELLKPNTKYTVTIPTTAVTGLTSYSWSFTTNAGTISSTETANADGISVYPTITSDIVVVKTTANAEIRLSDLTGRTLEIHNSAGGDYELNLSSRSAGVYFVVINSAEKTTVTRVIRK